MDFQDFKKQVSNYIEIDLNSYKERRVERRSKNLMKKHNLDTFKDCYQKIKSDSDFQIEFLQHMTINTTEFFRNKENFNYLAENILPELFSNYNKVKIWSAPSSIGCEPYTMAIILEEMNIDPNRYQLLATDVDPEAIRQAKLGKYKPNTLKKTDQKIIKKYFSKENGDYKINPSIKRLVEFDLLNLLEDNYYNNINLLLCRNFFIYLTKEVKQKLTKRLTSSLVKKGILFVGNTEYLLQPDKYNLEKLHTSFYQKK